MQYFLLTLSEKHDRNMTKRRFFYVLYSSQGDHRRRERPVRMSIFRLGIAGGMVLVWKWGSFINSKKKLNFLFI